jgi:hypothetical protein
LFAIKKLKKINIIKKNSRVKSKKIKVKRLKVKILSSNVSKESNVLLFANVVRKKV